MYNANSEVLSAFVEENMVNDSRIRILRILEILRSESDENHPITIVEILKIMNERWNMDSYRITVQKDIAALIDAGYPIEVVRSTQNRYYVTSQLFELPELKLLIDAVESGKFISEKKSRELTDKLTTLAIRSDRDSLKRNISISDRVKTGSEHLYYIMDALNDAINLKQKVRFLYFEYHAGNKELFKRVLGSSDGIYDLGAGTKLCIHIFFQVKVPLRCTNIVQVLAHSSDAL